MIYAIRIQDQPFVKIGVTNNVTVNRRLHQLQIGSPFLLELMAVCDGGALEEAEIHCDLKSAGVHHRGEWFRLEGETLKAIAEMLAKPRRNAQGPSKSGRLGRALGWTAAIDHEHHNRRLEQRKSVSERNEKKPEPVTLSRERARPDELTRIQRRRAERARWWLSDSRVAPINENANESMGRFRLNLNKS